MKITRINKYRRNPFSNGCSVHVISGVVVVLRGGSRSPRARSSTTSTPGITANRNSVRYWPGQIKRNTAARIGPTAAPAWSIARLKPNARPRVSGATESAIKASRGGFRVPFPNRSARRIARSCQGDVMIPISGRVTPAKAYPDSTNPFREPIRSDQAPDQSFTTLDAESTIPSITPSQNRLPPRTDNRNCGSRGKIISLATSLRKLTHPRMVTLGGSRRFEAVSTCCGGWYTVKDRFSPWSSTTEHTHTSLPSWLRAPPSQ